MGDSVGAVGRSKRLARNGRRGGRVDGGIARRIAGETEGPARCRQMGVDEEELEARISQMLLDAPPDPGPGSRRPGLPGAARPIGTLRKPTSGRRAAKDPAVLRDPDGKL